MKIRFLIYPLILISALLILAISCKKDNEKKDVTITWANPADIRVGTLLSATQLNATANVPGTFTYTPAIGTKLYLGDDQSLKVDFTPTDEDSYHTAMKRVTINVIPKLEPIITWANPADIYIRRPLSDTQLNATADVPGTFVYTPAIGAVLGIGANRTLKVDFTPTDTVNYSIVSKEVKINVIPYTFTDPRDGSVYQYDTIGTQVWMLENLRYLPSVVGGDIGSSTTPYYYVCDYNGTSVTEAKAKSNYRYYGVLYNWPAAKNACPTGWHLPSDYEWQQLIAYHGGSDEAGAKLKESGTNNWCGPSYSTNETRFTALPGGYRDGMFRIFGQLYLLGFWWSDTEIDNSYAWSVRMYYYNDKVMRFDCNKADGFSVRCIKD